MTVGNVEEMISGGSGRGWGGRSVRCLCIERILLLFNNSTWIRVGVEREFLALFRLHYVERENREENQGADSPWQQHLLSSHVRHFPAAPRQSLTSSASTPPSTMPCRLA